MKFIITTALSLLVAVASAQTELSVAECRKMALDYNKQLRQDKNKEISSQYDVQIAKRQRLPMFDGSASGVLTKDMDIMEGTTLQMRGMFTAGFTLKWPIYAGGQISNGIRLAKVGREVSEIQTRKTKADVIADADNNYYTLMAVREKVQMLETYKRQMQGLYDQVSISVRAGMSTENDLLRIEAKRSEIDYQLRKAKNGEKLCCMALCDAIGIDFDTTVVLTDSVFTVDLAETLDNDASKRPEIELLQKQVEASEYQVKMERSNYLPTVALVGGYFWYGNIKMKGTTVLEDGTPYEYTNKIHDNMPMAMLSANIPIFHWGTEVKRLKKAKLDLENSKLSLEDNTQKISIQVQQAVQNMEDDARLIESAQLGMSQADESHRVMRQKFDNGFVTLSDMLDAEAQWSQAKANLIEALTQQKIDYTEYLRAVGRLDVEQ